MAETLNKTFIQLKFVCRKNMADTKLKRKQTVTDSAKKRQNTVHFRINVKFTHDSRFERVGKIT